MDMAALMDMAAVLMEAMAVLIQAHMEATGEQSALVQARMEAMAVALTQALMEVMAVSLEFRGVAPMEVTEAAAEVTEAPMEVTDMEAHMEVVTEAVLMEADMEAAAGKSDRPRPPQPARCRGSLQRMMIAPHGGCLRAARRASAIGSLYGQSDPWETPSTRPGNV